MIYWNAIIMLADIRKMVEKGTLTAAAQVESGTVLFVSQNSPQGVVYQQIVFDTLPMPAQDQILYKGIGAEVSGVKIMGIFHVWPVDIPATTAPWAS